MRAFGEGYGLWRVDVVLRGDPTGGADGVLAQLEARLGLDDGTEAPFGDLRETSSFDMDPPEGSPGVSCWVRADGPGAAVQLGWDEVRAAARSATGSDLPLWDLRLIPREAIATRADAPVRASSRATWWPKRRPRADRFLRRSRPPG